MEQQELQTGAKPEWYEGPGAGEARDRPYFWVTWLSALMVGDITCTLAIWFKAHRQRYKKTDKRGNLNNWKIKHRALLEQIVTHLVMEDTEANVTMEDENSITVWGSKATIGGKPDIIKRVPGLWHIYDGKTGAPGDSDKAQMWLYKWLSLMQDKARKVVLTLVYGEWPGIDVNIENEMALKESATAWVNSLSNPVPPAARPNGKECRDCDISVCPFRATAGLIEISTDEF